MRSKLEMMRRGWGTWVRTQKVGALDLTKDDLDRVDNLLAYIHVHWTKAKTYMRDWTDPSGEVPKDASSGKRNKVQLWGNLHSKKPISFGKFGESNGDCPIEKENLWGNKVQELEFGVIRDDNLLYLENDWMDPEKHPNVDHIDLEFWFFCESTGSEKDLMQVLFLTSQEEVMLGIKKSKVFLKLNKKSKS
jgi:hypothetical protein